MFEQCLYFNTTALARVLDREWSVAFARFDLTPPQAFLLRAVLAQPGQSPHQLAALLVIARPTVTRLLDGLERKGLITRRGAEQDRRGVVVLPTDAACAQAEALNAAAGAVTARLRAQFGEEIFRTVVAQLRHLRHGLDDPAD